MWQIFRCLSDGSLVESRKWDQIRRKSRDFLSKCHGNSMTWTCSKSMSCSSMKNKYNLDKWHGIVMEFGVDFDQNAVELWREMTWSFHENPYHNFYRVCMHFYTITFIFNSVISTNECIMSYDLWQLINTLLLVNDVYLRKIPKGKITKFYDSESWTHSL